MPNQDVQGLGLGLRFEHFDSILKFKPKVPWFEVIVEDFLEEGPHHKKLEKIRENYPIIFHSVGLNLGGVDEFNIEHLNSVKNIYERYRPAWVSDHLCWSSHKGHFHHDLLPIPKTKEALNNVSGRINHLQDFFNRELVVENITSYIDYKNNEFDEIEFIEEVVNRTNCKLLLDITNVLINFKNRDENFQHYIESFPMKHVKQVHLAGSTEIGDIIVDAHNSEVKDEDVHVLKTLYQKGFSFPAMIERDSNIPRFEILEKERQEIERSLYEL